jgi:nitrate reductase NapAB chaperone NapD
MTDLSDREIVIQHIVVTTLPFILERDSKKFQELGFLSAYGLNNKKLLIVIESTQREVRALLRQRKISIIDLQTKDGIKCTYKTLGYEDRVDMLPSVIKSACDAFLQRIKGILPDENIL